MHDAAYAYVAATVDRFDLHTARTVLDLGGRNVNGTTRPLFADTTTYVVVDLADADNVNVIADAADVDLGVTFDVVVSTELLEHTDRGAAIVANAYRHAEPGGMFVATMAGPGRAPHGQHGAALPAPDEFYRNVHPDDLRGWLSSAGFTMFEIDRAGVDVRCWARR